MGRKHTKINAIRGERLKALLEEKGIDQKVFAEKIGYTPEHISYIINGKRNLTQDAAEGIVKIFPEIRVGWLLGYDDYETDDDLLRATAKENLGTVLAINDLLQFAARYIGYKIDSTLEIEPKMFQSYDPNEIQGYLIKDNTRIAITSADVDFLANEVVRFAIFALEGLIYKKSDSWHPFYLNMEMFDNG